MNTVVVIQKNVVDLEIYAEILGSLSGLEKLHVHIYFLYLIDS